MSLYFIRYYHEKKYNSITYIMEKFFRQKATFIGGCKTDRKHFYREAIWGRRIQRGRLIGRLEKDFLMVYGLHLGRVTWSLV